MKKIIFVLMSLLFVSQVQAFDVVNGCEEEDYVDGDTIASVGVQGLEYTPKCLRVVVGSEVTISASGHHPLAPLAGQNNNNPIPSTSSTTTVTFDEVGTFGYVCVNHESLGMVGTILVVEE